jgi:hypothetical protein
LIAELLKVRIIFIFPFLITTNERIDFVIQVFNDRYEIHFVVSGAEIEMKK